MKYHLKHEGPLRRTIRTRRLKLLTAGLIAVGGAQCLTGCQTVTQSQSARIDGAGSQPTLGSNQGQTGQELSQTGFRSEPTPDEQFNVHVELGRVFETQSEFTAALDSYQKALEIATRRGFGSGVKGSGEKLALVHRRLGGTLDRLGRFAQAEDHYRQALKAGPDNPKVWNDAGYSYYLQGRWADAERSLKTAAKLSPDDSRIQTNLGLTLAAAGKSDEALLALTKAGGSAVAHANLGYLLAAMDKKAEAREHYKQAIELQPNLAPAHQALAALDSSHAKASSVAETLIPRQPTAEPVQTAAKVDPKISRTSVGEPGPRAKLLKVRSLPNP